MQLRSGNVYRDNLNVTLRKKKTLIRRRYNEFRNKCQGYIGELNDATCSLERVHTLYKLYSFVYDEKDNVSSYIDMHPSLTDFLYRVANDIPRFIREIISVNRDPEISWVDMTGLTVMQDAFIFYDLRQFLLMIIEFHTENQ